MGRKRKESNIASVMYSYVGTGSVKSFSQIGLQSLG